MKIIRALYSLCDAVGVGGMTQAADVAEALLAPLCDTVWRDPLGNVYASRRCGREGAPTLLLTAHLDEIGLVVTDVDSKGFIHFDACGGVDMRALAAAPVTVWGSCPLAGVISSVPPHLATAVDAKTPSCKELAIDVGLSAEEAVELICVGDRVSFVGNMCALEDGCVTAKALDDRAGVAAILHALSLLDETATMDVTVCLTVQEELGCIGALAAGSRVTADAAIVTDVSFALTPDADPHACGVLGAGAMLGMSPVLDYSLARRLKALAKAAEIPLQYEVVGGKTGSDADAIAIAGGGIRTALLSIPLRYMHTPTELVAVRDIEAVGRLMAVAVTEGVV